MMLRHPFKWSKVKYHFLRPISPTTNTGWLYIDDDDYDTIMIDDDFDTIMMIMIQLWRQTHSKFEEKGFCAIKPFCAMKPCDKF